MTHSFVSFRLGSYRIELVLIDLVLIEFLIEFLRISDRIFLGFDFENVVVNIDMISLRKSDNPINKFFVLKKLPGLFVKIKSIQVELQASLKQVGFLFILCSLCWNKKLPRHFPSILALKSQINSTFL